MSQMNWINTGILMLLVSMFFYVLRAVYDKRLFRELGWGAMLLAMVSLVISLVIRSQTAQYFALSNMYESMLVLIISMQGAFLIMDRWFRIPTFGWPVSLLLLLALVYDTTLPTEIRPLQAALQSYWRSIHVPVIILSYAMFTLAFISSSIYLVKSTFGKNASGESLGSAHPRLAGEISAFAENPTLTTTYGTAAAAQDSASIYDEITYRCVAFGFPLLTIGIILGGMWANEAWGNYWSWDPKESMSLVTLLGYGVYLHMRVNQEHSPRTLAIVSVVGFVLMLITYFGVNLMGVGLHSYGKIG